MHKILAYLMMLCASLDPGLGLAHPLRSIAVSITNTTAKIKVMHALQSDSLGSLQLQCHSMHSLERPCRPD